MRVGVITGTGTYALPGLEAGSPEPVATRFGETLVTRARLGETEVLHISRHGEGHRRLSSHVTHQANVAALEELGAECVLAVTVCGAVDPSVPLGSLIVFDDLHFLVNRLADGSICTLHDQPGDRRRAHWIYEGPFAEGGRAALLEACQGAGVPVRDGGCYGHVDGPRFNTRAEIRSLALAGVTAVSQTAGPETVLCGEAELPIRAARLRDRLRERSQGRANAGRGAAAADRGEHSRLCARALRRAAEASRARPRAARDALPLRAVRHVPDQVRSTARRTGRAPERRSRRASSAP